MFPHGKIELVELRGEEARPRTADCLDSAKLIIVVGIALLEHRDPAFASDCIDPVTPLVGYITSISRTQTTRLRSKCGQAPSRQIGSASQLLLSVLVLPLNDNIRLPTLHRSSGRTRTQQRATDDGPSDRARENPVSDGRKLLPERQTLSVVHVEGRQQQDVRHTHLR
jgi:hypothetical protein